MTSNFNFNPLPLYYDSECTRPVPYKVKDDKFVYEPMNMGRLDELTTRLNRFYIKNIGMAVIEDVSIKIDGVDKENVESTLVSPSTIARFGVLQVYRGVVELKALKGVKAGPCMVNIDIRGMLTQE